MRPTATTSLAVAASALLLSLSACSSATDHASDAGSGKQASAAKAALSDENIAKIVASYSGEDSKLPDTFGTAQPASLKIGWSAARKANELNARVGTAVKKQTEALGGSFTELDANGDVPTQIHQVEQLINDGVDAIVVWPLDANSLNAVFGQAKAKGIPVIAVEITPDGAPKLGNVTAQIIYGRDEGAYVEAKAMAEILPKGSEVATVKFTVAVPTIDYYAERAAYWAKENGLDVVASIDNPSDDVPGGQQATGPLLQSHPHVKGILAYNDSSALGAAAAALTVRHQLVAFGVNGEDQGLDGIKGGKYSLTIQPPVVKWGKELVNAAYLAKAGRTIPQTVYPGLGSVITTENASGAQQILQTINAASYGQ
jgi:ABC-type sugar transport system substrate-binding protein